MAMHCRLVLPVFLLKMSPFACYCLNRIFLRSASNSWDVQFQKKFSFWYIEIIFLQLSTAGGRLIISSDGVWDALTAETAFDCCRGMPADAAAAQIVKVCYS